MLINAKNPETYDGSENKHVKMNKIKNGINIKIIFMINF